MKVSSVGIAFTSKTSFVVRLRVKRTGQLLCLAPGRPSTRNRSASTAKTSVAKRRTANGSSIRLQWDRLPNASVIETTSLRGKNVGKDKVGNQSYLPAHSIRLSWIE